MADPPRKSILRCASTRHSLTAQSRIARAVPTENPRPVQASRLAVAEPVQGATETWDSAVEANASATSMRGVAVSVPSGPVRKP